MAEPPLYVAIQQAIDLGLDQAALVLGTAWSAYRVTSTCSGHFPDGWQQIAADVPIYRRRVTAAKIESALLASGTVFYDIDADMSPFNLGDVFVCTDPYYGDNATHVAGDSFEFAGMALAWAPPVRVRVAARIDRRIAIYRPSQQPANDPTGLSDWNASEEADTPLVLSNGTYAFGAAGGQASWVPAGFASTERPSRGPMILPADSDMPATIRYYCYLPPLPGYRPAEGDRVRTEDGTRLVVQHPFAQNVGVVGSQLVLERRGAATG